MAGKIFAGCHTCGETTISLNGARVNLNEFLFACRNDSVRQ